MLNGSELIHDPWNTTFFPFIRLMGQEWILIPFIFIAGALFIKTRDTAVIGVYMIIVGAMFSGASIIFSSGGLIAFMLFAGIGIGILVYNVFMGGK